MPKGIALDREPRAGGGIPDVVTDKELGVQDGVGRRPKRPKAKDENGGPTRAWTPEEQHAKESDLDVDSPLLHEIKREFENIQSEIYDALTDEMLAAVIEEDKNAKSSGE
jgi:hypothetical protein